MADRRRRPQATTYLRRRVMAVAIAAAVVGIITSLVAGENGGSLSRQQAKITGPPGPAVGGRPSAPRPPEAPGASRRNTGPLDPWIRRLLHSVRLSPTS